MQTTSAVREYDANDKIKAAKQLLNGPRGEGFIRQPLFPRLRTLFASQLGATAQRKIRGRKEQDGRPPATYTEHRRGGVTWQADWKQARRYVGGTGRRLRRLRRQWMAQDEECGDGGGCCWGASVGYTLSVWLIKPTICLCATRGSTGSSPDIQSSRFTSKLLLCSYLTPKHEALHLKLWCAITCILC